jgi:hypothetical protein
MLQPVVYVCVQLALALTIVQVCPFSEEDLMISVLLNMFDSRASLVGFLKALIDNEIQHVGSYNCSSSVCFVCLPNPNFR